jgi:hypothetical protein
MCPNDLRHRRAFVSGDFQFNSIGVRVQRLVEIYRESRHIFRRQSYSFEFPPVDENFRRAIFSRRVCRAVADCGEKRMENVNRRLRRMPNAVSVFIFPAKTVCL